MTSTLRVFDIPELTLTILEQLPIRERARLQHIDNNWYNAITAINTLLTSHQIFRTPKIFLQILEHLPPEELIRLQQVSKTWRDAMTSSIKLRRQLFLSPDTSISQATCEVRWNPYLFRPQKLVPSPYEEDKSFEPNSYRIIDAKRLKDMYLNQNPWLSMLMTQPPVKKVRLWHGEALRCSFYGSTYVENEHGVSFADLDSLPVTVWSLVEPHRKAKKRKQVEREAWTMVHLQ